MVTELRTRGIDTSQLLDRRDVRQALERARLNGRLCWRPLEVTRWSSAEMTEPQLFGASLNFLDRVADYTHLKRFFTKILGVREAPSADDFAHLLREIVCQQWPRADTPSRLGLRKSVLCIYAELHRSVTSTDALATAIRG